MAIAKFPATVTMPKADEPYPSILEFLATRFPRIGREVWVERIEAGKVLNEDYCPVSFDTAYTPLKRLFYFREVKEELPIPFKEEIVYQNENFLVADKPHFLPTTEGGRFVEESLIHRLRERTGNDDIAPIHRIDRETAGLVMFSLNPQVRSPYQSMFENRCVEKIYHAISGIVPGGLEREWLVENRLEEGSPSFRIGSFEGENNAVSRIEFMMTSGNRAYFHLYPFTGKRHQLRFHMATLGYPIENDKYYPQLQNESPDNYDKPLQLIAKELRFKDPITCSRRHFVSRRLLKW